MFDLRSEQIIQHYEAHHDAVNSFSLHPEGNHMVSVSANSEIKVKLNLFRSGVSRKAPLPIACLDTLVTSKPQLFPVKAISLPQEELTVLF